MLTAGEGETLKLGPPLHGEVTILVAPAPPNGSLTMGTQTLPSGRVMERHRHLHYDKVWFVHKGQGRATVEGQTKTVVPGVTVSVPRGAWHSLQNTGTGLLQIVWVSAPAGLEQLFRELSRQGGAPWDAVALQTIAQRHGTEFGGDNGAKPSAIHASSPRRHRRRRGHRRGEKGLRAVMESIAHAPSTAASTSAVLQEPSPVTAPPQPSPPTPRGSKGRSGPPSASSMTHRPSHAAGRRGNRRRHPHVKEVYMGGRWVKITGEGPIISTGGRDAIETPGSP